MKDKTELQKKFEQQTPTIQGVRGKEYLQTYCAWLEFQIAKVESKADDIIQDSIDSLGKLSKEASENYPENIKGWCDLDINYYRDIARLAWSERAKKTAAFEIKSVIGKQV